MSKRSYTILLIPGDHSEAKKLKLSARRLGLLKVGGLFLGALLSFAIYDYGGLLLDDMELTSLKKKNAAQTVELQDLSGKVEKLSGEMRNLRTFDQKLRIIAGLEVTSPEGDLFGVGGPDIDGGDPFGDYYKVSSRKETLIDKLHGELDGLGSDALLQEESFSALQDHLKDQTDLLSSTPSIWPTRGWVSSHFGRRISPFTGRSHHHNGLDIANSPGTPVYAPADGTVVKVGRNGHLGKSLTISHGHGIKTRYGHLSAYDVKVGQKVIRGERIASLGNTGRSTGPHLHYAVYVNGVPVNPTKYILN